MLIKVCGMRDAENVARLLELRPDFVGMIFYPKSPRFVSTTSDSQIKQKFQHVKKVGVFVNADYQTIMTTAEEFNLDTVQLHGTETPEFCKTVREKLPVIKAFGISDKSDLRKLEPYEDCADMFLFDTKTKLYGGSGSKFDWSVLSGYDGLPYLLSGGIDEDDIPKIASLELPKMSGVDLNSKFELAPALKDIEKLRKVLEQLEHRKH